jgi:predicted small secreted protein
MKKAAAILAIVLFGSLSLAACDSGKNTAAPVYNSKTTN